MLMVLRKIISAYEQYFSSRYVCLKTLTNVMIQSPIHSLSNTEALLRCVIRFAAALLYVQLGAFWHSRIIVCVGSVAAFEHTCACMLRLMANEYRESKLAPGF